MKHDKPLIDLTSPQPSIHLHIHASNLRDLAFARGVVDLIGGVDSDDAAFVRALTNRDVGALQELAPHGRVQ